MDKGKSCAVGGSVSLDQCNVLDLLRSGDFDFKDRYEEGIGPEGIKKVFRDSFFVDYYLCSANAITQDGFIHNVDSTGNRVSAINFGPDKVFLICGKNKLVESLKDAKD